jgi:hypothetical protein
MFQPVPSILQCSTQSLVKIPLPPVDASSGCFAQRVGVRICPQPDFSRRQERAVDLLVRARSVCARERLVGLALETVQQLFRSKQRIALRLV